MATRNSKRPLVRNAPEYYKGKIEADLARHPGAASLVTPEQIQAAANQAYARDLQKAAERAKRVDFLIQQIEKARGVELDRATRTAVMEALEGEQSRLEEENSAYASAIKTTDAMRLAIAGSYREDKGVNRMEEPVHLIAIWLIAAVLAPFALKPLLLAYICVILLFLVFFSYYWHEVEKQRKARAQMRESLAAGIREQGKTLPDHLRFLAEVPEGDPLMELIMLEADKEE